MTKLREFAVAVISAITLTMVSASMLPATAAGAELTSIDDYTYYQSSRVDPVDLNATFDPSSSEDFFGGYFTQDTSTVGCDLLPAGAAFGGNFGSSNPATSILVPVLTLSGPGTTTEDLRGVYNLCVVVHSTDPTIASKFDSRGFIFTVAGQVPPVYVPQGVSWIDVPMANRTYALTGYHLLGTSSYSEYDDESFEYLPSGDTCSVNQSSDNVVFAGPALISREDGSLDCTNDVAGSRGDEAIPFGFNINFGNTTYSGGYLTTNGMLTFAPSSDPDYNETLAYSAFNEKSSGISVMGVDLAYYAFANPATSSYLWTGNTTIDGKNAFVASWENAGSIDHEELKASFQIVLIDDGNGDFTAYFNYDNNEVNDQGYGATDIVAYLIDGKVGTNKYLTYDTNGLAAAFCYSNTSSTIVQNDGNTASSTSVGSFNLDADGNLSMFSDSSCAAAVTFASNDKYVYLQETDTISRSVPIGWYVYDATEEFDVIIQQTEFFPNISDDDLVDGGSLELISQSVNTAVLGRYVLGMVGGVTTGDQRDILTRAQNLQPVAAPVYSGPLVVGTTSAPAGSNVTLTGSRLSSVSQAWVGGKPCTSLSSSSGTLSIKLPVGLLPGTYDLVLSSGYGLLTVQSAITITAEDAPDVADNSLADNTWTKNQNNGSVKVYAKNVVGLGKVQFMFNGKEVAWIRASDLTDPKLRIANDANYLVRTLTLVSGQKNVFEIYVDGVRTTRSAYTY